MISDLDILMRKKNPLKKIDKDLENTPLHVIYQQFYKEFSIKKPYYIMMLSAMTEDGHYLLKFVNDDYSLKTLKDIRNFYHAKYYHNADFIYWLTKPFEDKNPGAYAELDLILFFYFEWENGKKFFGDFKIYLDKKDYEKSLNIILEGLKDTDFEDITPDELIKKTKIRMDKIFGM